MPVRLEVEAQFTLLWLTMVAKITDAKKKSWRDDEKGQAIFEFILFLPFFFILYVVLSSVAGAINGSINQQKVTRGYFYYVLKHNSFAPRRDELNGFQGRFNSLAGYAFGHAVRLEGEQPVATCYQNAALTNISARENCEDRDTTGPTKFIRLYTAFGVCTQSFIQENGRFRYAPLSYASAGGNSAALLCSSASN